MALPAGLRAPAADDSKRTRGTAGLLVGSDRYPGAAVLAANGAWRTGVGMVRAWGDARVQDAVLVSRPETIVSTLDNVEACDAYALGAGQDSADRDDMLREAQLWMCDSGAPVVLDAGALNLALRVTGPALLTPHVGELQRLLGWLWHPVEVADIVEDPAHYARVAAEGTGAVVLLKGATTVIATPAGDLRTVAAPTHRLATAGSGDVLTGILGGLAARARVTDAEAFAELAAFGAEVHGAAAARLGDRPLVALEIAGAVADVIGERERAEG